MTHIVEVFLAYITQCIPNRADTRINQTWHVNNTEYYLSHLNKGTSPVICDNMDESEDTVLRKISQTLRDLIHLRDL